MSTVKSLLADGLSEPVLKVEEIGVMAPWREQVWKLRERLRADGLSGVDVGTVEVDEHTFCSIIELMSY